MRRYVAAVVLTLAGVPALAQTSPGDAPPGLGALMPNIFKLNGTCARLVTPDGDQTALCDKELMNLAFASGNSSFVATIKEKGGVSFRGRDSAAKGDVASIKLDTVLLTGGDLSQPMQTIKAKGQCTYTNPNKGPVHVDCSADTAKGKYELSFVSDGVWPPK